MRRAEVFMAPLFAKVAPTSAARWLRWRAERGLAKAQFNLAAMYGEGWGVPQDNAEAAKWYRKAAEQGLAKAQLFLAAMYDEGRGVPQNDVQAVKWYRKAAEQGLATAMLSLGLMYYKGRGVPQHLVSAWAWLDRAASRSPPGRNRNKAARARKGVAAKMTWADVDEIQALTRDPSKRAELPNRTEGERP